MFPEYFDWSAEKIWLWDEICCLNGFENKEEKEAINYCIGMS